MKNIRQASPVTGTGNHFSILLHCFACKHQTTVNACPFPAFHICIDSVTDKQGLFRSASCFFQTGIYHSGCRFADIFRFSANRCRNHPADGTAVRYHSEINRATQIRICCKPGNFCLCELFTDLNQFLIGKLCIISAKYAVYIISCLICDVQTCFSQFAAVGFGSCYRIFSFP